ncbi:MAG: hypothetical protein R3344_00495 [Acidobacteriota bacterium]|nr:hypothetical protein [Acidobacteriota bacterium]
MNRRQRVFGLGLGLVASFLLVGVLRSEAADCYGWSMDRNRLGTPEREHGSLRIATAEGVWQWEYGPDKLLELYAVALKFPDEATREKKLKKIKKRLTSKHGEPRAEDPYGETTEEYLQRFLVADQHGDATERWLEEVSPDGVWFSEECNAHVSLYRGTGNGRYYSIVLLHPVSGTAEE